MSKAQVAFRPRSHMRAWGIGLILLLIIAPASASAPALVTILDEWDELPRWHSVVLQWEGTRRLEGEMTVYWPEGGQLVRGGGNPMWGSATVFEMQRSDGSWFWFAAIEGHGADISSNAARLTLRAPAEIDFEQTPDLVTQQGGSTFGWALTGTGGRYRITTWGAAEFEGYFGFPLRADPGVEFVARTEGSAARFVRADDSAAVSVGGDVRNHGVWTRALANVTNYFEHLAFITDPSGGQGQTCICRYAGPQPGWNGVIGPNFGPTRVPSAFAAPPGTYSIEVIASQNNREREPDPFNPTRLPARSYNDALAWTFADVDPPDV